MNINESPRIDSDNLAFALRELADMIDHNRISESRIDDLIESIDYDDESRELADAFCDLAHRIIDL